MRLRLEGGKQRELIYLAKGNLSWRNLSKSVGVSQGYLCNDLRVERRFLIDSLYEKLCSIADVDFDDFILERLDDNWGRSKGGINSVGRFKKIVYPSWSEGLAEFVGAVLGDGHVHCTCKKKNGNCIGVYQIRITGDKRYEEDYHKYLGKLSVSLFKLIPRFCVKENKNERYVYLSSKSLVEFFGEMNIFPGNKIVNQSTIPSWIFGDLKFLRACVRGLIDTDGCIYRMPKRDSNLLRINFKNHNEKLLKDARRAFLLLGFYPSKIINGNVFYISRQEEIGKYLKEIGFSNKKHLDRLEMFRVP